MTWGVQGLSVTFGHRRALDRIDLAVEPGEVLAVIGGDGAGKTTLLKVLAGIGIPHQGRVVLPPSGDTGYVPPQGGIYRDLTVDEHLEFAAAAYRLTDWDQRARRLLERTDLSAFRGRLAGKLSGGQQRKLAGSIALLPQPRLLVLDEVTTGVDPVSRLGLWRLVAGAAAEGTAVVFATSYLDEAERAAHVLLLHDGVVIGSGTPDEVAARIPGSVQVVDGPRDPTRAWRHGRRWRQWDPAAPRSHPVSLEDAAIVAELIAEGGTA